MSENKPKVEYDIDFAPVYTTNTYYCTGCGCMVPGQENAMSAHEAFHRLLAAYSTKMLIPA